VPRKIRTPKGQVAALPSAAWTYALLTGERPACRLVGWVQQAHEGQYGEPTAADVWAQHRDALIAEATDVGFEPYFVRNSAPAGPRFRAWRQRFLQDHRY